MKKASALKMKVKIQAKGWEALDRLISFLLLGLLDCGSC